MVRIHCRSWVFSVFSSKGVRALTLLADQPECLWDDVLPLEVKELPEDLAALDVLLSDHELLWPLVERWRAEFEQTGRLVLTEGRPTIAIETFVRLMVLKQRYRWGYRTLVAEVSDSIHLGDHAHVAVAQPRDHGRAVLAQQPVRGARAPGDLAAAHARCGQGRTR